MSEPPKQKPFLLRIAEYARDLEQARGKILTAPEVARAWNAECEERPITANTVRNARQQFKLPRPTDS